jgi:hypothetical protein
MNIIKLVEQSHIFSQLDLVYLPNLPRKLMENAFFLIEGKQ